ncbi:XdhC family protein [uncultured Streptomyces sp.]|uniref:XdhC family protein n=1 Tax=uncultured Streptomyces sp. TaxID=174707 RepID=UPI003439F087
MLNIADTLLNWCREKRPFALATVLDIKDSAPPPLGSALAVGADGSVSGGRVEDAVYDLCRYVLNGDEPATRARFGYAYDDAFAVGLTCGGDLDILGQRIDPGTRPHLPRPRTTWRSAGPSQWPRSPTDPNTSLAFVSPVTTTRTGAGGPRGRRHWPASGDGLW